MSNFKSKLKLKIKDARNLMIYVDVVEIMIYYLIYKLIK
jgi:hypothetical protein